MATRTFHCSQCDALVAVDDADQTSACPSCGVWFHATECARCAHVYLALGLGRQECPNCHLRIRFNERSVRAMAQVSDPLEDNISIVRSRVGSPVDQALAVGPVLVGDPMATTLSTILWIGSMVVIATGIVALGVVIAHVHHDVALAVVELLLATLVPAAILGALAFIVERVDEHTRQLQHLIEVLERTAVAD